MLTQLKEKLAGLRYELFHHPLYDQIVTQEDLKVFMESHVFAVWDFMSLVKRLQRDISCVDIPWLPVSNPGLARFINEINLGEETDIGPNHEPISHLVLYVNAMKEVGADTRCFDHFLDLVRQTKNVSLALEKANVEDFVSQFVNKTMNVVHQNSTLEVATYFLVGREDPIPTMFQRILTHWTEVEKAPQFIFYLKRHIQVDGEEHGPAAEKMLSILLAENHKNLADILPIAEKAIRSRIALWDGIVQNLSQKKQILEKPIGVLR